jgi:DNA invertase Pin-like site-specific DNA recombinase
VRDRRSKSLAGAKLTPRQVLTIRRRLAAGETQAAIAADFGITKANVSAINRRLTWIEVRGPEGRHTSEARGERNGRAKLTEADVREIRRRRESIKAQAKRFGVSVHTIEKVRNRESWRHVIP